MQVLSAVVVHLLLVAAVSASADTSPGFGLRCFDINPAIDQTTGKSDSISPLSAILSPLPQSLVLDGGWTVPSPATSPTAPAIKSVPPSAALRGLGGCFVSSPPNPLLFATEPTLLLYNCS
ncbi:hypothetical protein HPB52_012291 [Rhipicephalus sanguineus]|uniref:Uncharacterized protein n=1 Tax=Rhipicephalus sanguineus TaxID=34632 RepID=A0A9D4PB99_RHISA|nr:hypothetical protein HPB52_012291 [Rhipicephalus sanguineus]